MPKAKDRRVWLLVISHRHGANYYAAESEDLARELLHAYVKHWWNDDEDPPEQPKDPQKAIKLYFSECREDESWEIVDCAITTPDNLKRHRKEI